MSHHSLLFLPVPPEHLLRRDNELLWHQCDKSLGEAQEKLSCLLGLRKPLDCSTPRDWLLGFIPKFWELSISMVSLSSSSSPLCISLEDSGNWRLLATTSSCQLVSAGKSQGQGHYGKVTLQP